MDLSLLTFSQPVTRHLPRRRITWEMQLCGNAHSQRFRAASAVLLWTACVLGAPIARAANAPPTPAEHKITQSESYVTVDPIYSTILDGGKPSGLLLVELGLDIPDAGLRARARAALPVLRDAYVRSLASYAAVAVRPWRQPSVDDIANRIQAITDHLLSQKGAKVLMAQTAIRITH